MLTDQAHALREMVRGGGIATEVGPPPPDQEGGGPRIGLSADRPQWPRKPASPAAALPTAGATRVREAGAGRASVVAITSGKGGVGKSSVVVNLAVRLSQMGRRVLVMDADLGTANADVLCNLSPSAGLAHVLAGRRTLRETIIEGPGGFRLIPGASGLAQVAAMGESARGRLAAQMRDLEREADVILVDTGAGVGPNVLSFVCAADQQLVVTTPEPTAMTDAYALIKTVWRQRADLNVRILVNMVRSADEARAVFGRLDAVCRRFLKLTPRYAGHLMHDVRVPLAVRRRVPFVLENPRCDASRGIAQLAHRMDRHAAEPSGEGLLRRMMTWFGA